MYMYTCISSYLKHVRIHVHRHIERGRERERDTILRCFRVVVTKLKSPYFDKARVPVLPKRLTSLNG